MAAKSQTLFIGVEIPPIVLHLVAAYVLFQSCTILGMSRAVAFGDVYIVTKNTFCSHEHHRIGAVGGTRRTFVQCQLFALM